jgi:hypothetical protein
MRYEIQGPGFFFKKKNLIFLTWDKGILRKKKKNQNGQIVIVWKFLGGEFKCYILNIRNQSTNKLIVQESKVYFFSFGVKI